MNEQDREALDQHLKSIGLPTKRDATAPTLYADQGSLFVHNGWIAALAHRDAEQEDYRKAVDNELVSRYIGVASGNPKLEIRQIVDWDILVHDDPAVSEVARERIDKLASQQAEIERLKGELKELKALRGPQPPTPAAIAITLPFPDPKLHAHNKGHWRTKRQAVKDLRLQGMLAANGKVNKPIESATICYDIYYPAKRKYDLANTVQSCKPAIDGVVDAGVLVDDNWQVLEIGYVRGHLDRKNPRVVVTIFDHCNNLRETQ